MKDSLKFTLAIDNLERKISELNIKISKTPNENLQKELEILLKDKENIFKKNQDEVKILIEKYGSINNG